MSTPDQPPPTDQPRLSAPAVANAPVVANAPAVAVVWSDAARRALPDTRVRPLWTRRARRAVSLCLARTPPLHPALLAQWAQFHERGTVDVSFVADAEIARLNGEYRDKPRPTDVLSFSQWEDATVWPDTVELPLGDVVIAVETTLRQAAEHGHEPAAEVAFLCLHGTLHLLGYDHADAKGRRQMWQQQELLMDELRRNRRKAARRPASPPA